jgi:hypothetical protein
MPRSSSPRENSLRSVINHSHRNAHRRKKRVSSHRCLQLESLASRQLFAADLPVATDLPMVIECFGFPADTAAEVSMHNVSKPADVDRNGKVNPVDALRIIDSLNRFGAMSVHEFSARQSSSNANNPTAGARGEGEAADESKVSEITPTSFDGLDANNDGSINPIDVLVVIDALNEIVMASASEPSPFAVAAFSESTVEDNELQIAMSVGSESSEIQPIAYETEVSEEKDPWMTTGVPDGAWVRFGSESEDETPSFYTSLEVWPLLGSEEEVSILAMGTSSQSNAVPVFSQDGPLYRVFESQSKLGENPNNSPAVTAMVYFSSNFLKSRS